MRLRFRHVVALSVCCLLWLTAGSSVAGPFGIPGLGKIPGIPNIPRVGNIPLSNVPNIGRLQRLANGSQFMQQYVVPNLVNNQGVPITNNLVRSTAPQPGLTPNGPVGARSVRNYAPAANSPTIPQLPLDPAPAVAPAATAASPATTPTASPTIPSLPPTGPAPVAAGPAPQRPAGSLEMDDVESAVEFASRGESEFRNGNYKQASRMFRHALLDSPQNGMLMLMLAQAQFAQGQHIESAVTTYDAIDLLPEEHWGIVVTNYQSLYGNPGQYTEQLRSLEKRLKERGDDPVLRFLVGYHYGYIGYPKNAVLELDKVIPTLPDDQLSVRLRNVMATRAGLPPAEKVVTSPTTPAQP